VFDVYVPENTKLHDEKDWNQHLIFLDFPLHLAKVKRLNYNTGKEEEVKSKFKLYETIDVI
jgi:hypothetical protein